MKRMKLAALGAAMLMGTGVAGVDGDNDNG